MHITHDPCHVPAHLGAGHGKQGVYAVDQGCSRSQGYQRIHVGRPVDQALEAADEKLLVDYHDNGCQD